MDQKRVNCPHSSCLVLPCCRKREAVRFDSKGADVPNLLHVWRCGGQNETWTSSQGFHQELHLWWIGVCCGQWGICQNLEFELIYCTEILWVLVFSFCSMSSENHPRTKNGNLGVGLGWVGVNYGYWIIDPHLCVCGIRTSDKEGHAPVGHLSGKVCTVP